MGILDAINLAEGAMSVHRFRSEVAAENIANIHTPGYRRKEVDLRAQSFGTSLGAARAARAHDIGPSANGGMDANTGAVQVRGVRDVAAGPFSERQQALLATTDMMRAKSAFELNVRSATLLKSMATSSLEIGRGS